MAVEDTDVNGDPDDKQRTFEQLFKKPTIEAMLELSWQDFQAFVAYVFTYAGFTVDEVSTQFFPHGPGVDFNLFHGSVKGRPAARLEVRKYAPAHPLSFSDVAAFLGVLELNQGVPGYLVTTSSFGGPAREAARQANGRVRLVDGKTLIRYITYVNGSRVEGQYGSVAVSPAQPIAPTLLERATQAAQSTARPPRHTRILVVSNIKGGVAKTTSALNIGFALSDLKHQRVLMIDLDGQGSLTHSLPRPPLAPPEPQRGRRARAAVPAEPPPPDTRFLSDYFRGHHSLAGVIRPTRFEGLWIAPAHSDLYRIQFAGADRTQAELNFFEDLRSLKMHGENGEPLPPFDWIVIDTPAGNSYYGRAALAAADYIVMPALAEAYASNGIDETLDLVATMSALTQDADTWRSRMLGCFVTRWRSGANASEALLKLQNALEVSLALHLFRERIPLDDRVETAHRGTIGGGGRNIFRLSPQMGQAAQAYDRFVEEMLQHVYAREAAPQH